MLKTKVFFNYLILSVKIIIWLSTIAWAISVLTVPIGAKNKFLLLIPVYVVILLSLWKFFIYKEVREEYLKIIGKFLSGAGGWLLVIAILAWLVCLIIGVAGLFSSMPFWAAIIIVLLLIKA